MNYDRINWPAIIEMLTIEYDEDMAQQAVLETLAAIAVREAWEANPEGEEPDKVVNPAGFATRVAELRVIDALRKVKGIKRRGRRAMVKNDVSIDRFTRYGEGGEDFPTALIDYRDPETLAIEVEEEAIKERVQALYREPIETAMAVGRERMASYWRAKYKAALRRALDV